MLDTNVFNFLLDGAFDLNEIGDGRWLTTGVQWDELAATKSVDRRTALLSRIQLVDPERTRAASFTWDIAGAGFDEAYWNDGSSLFERMLDRLQDLDMAAGKKATRENQLCDIVIIETAMREGATLLTGDRNLASVTVEFGGIARFIERRRR